MFSKEFYQVFHYDMLQQIQYLYYRLT